MGIISDRMNQEPPQGDGRQIERLQSLQFRTQQSVETMPPNNRWRTRQTLMVGGALLGAALLGGIASFLFFVPSANAPKPQTVEASATAPAVAQGQGRIVASGYVVARRQATIASEITGRLVRMAVEEGQEVRAGQLLAELDDVAAAAQLSNAAAGARSARADVAGRRAVRAEAERDLARTRALVERGFTTPATLSARQTALKVAESNLAASTAALAAAEASMAQSRSLVGKHRIVAPFSGIVVSTNAQVGEIISPVSAGGGFTRTGICTIVDMHSLEVEVQVNEALISQIRLGQPVSVVLDAYPDLRIPGKVVATIPTADRERSSIRLRIGFLASDPRILPNMAVKVAFETQERTHGS
jgi:RND family efflux transporter MFP subunit